jgi:predicted nucleotidyltransferase
VHRWPDAETVLTGARQWAARLAAHKPGVLAVGCFGSYARGDAAVGSDLDLVVIVRDDDALPNPADDLWAVERLPVPADRLAYTAEQWAQLRAADSRFWRTIEREARWLVGKPPAPDEP